jgi:hypothetical protein
LPALAFRDSSTPSPVCLIRAVKFAVDVANAPFVVPELRSIDLNRCL